MKQKHSIFLLSLLSIIQIPMLFYYIPLFFSIGFDAADNMWPFSRYYFRIYQSEMVFMVLCLIALTLSIFLKNILIQKKGRYLMIISNYGFKVVLALSFINQLSAMHILLSLNMLTAHMSMFMFIILATLFNILLSLIILIREVIAKLKIKKHA